VSAPAFVFAVPFKPRRACADWQQAQANLRRTVRSARAAAGGADAAIVIACHELPELQEAAGPDVRLLEVPFVLSTGYWGGGADKARKRRFVGAWLRAQLAPGEQVQVMFLDADDLVHRDLVRHVLGSPAGSHVVEHGYILDVAGGLLQHRRSGFHHTCGSSFACRFEREELPRSHDDLDAVFSRFGAAPGQRGHHEYPRLAEELGRPPRRFPFPAVVYMANHPESLWAARSGLQRRVDRVRDLVLPSQARRILTDEFAAGDCADRLAGPGGVTGAVALVVGRRLRRGLRTLAPRPAKAWGRSRAGARRPGGAGVAAPLTRDAVLAEIEERSTGPFHLG
jgi:hypothetical protein